MLEIVYIHIPKTGGSSVLELFSKNYSSDQICEIKRNMFNKNPKVDSSSILINSISDNTKVLHGHFTYREVMPLLKIQPNVKIITFLRHPIDRVISNYRYFTTRLQRGQVPEEQLDRKNETLLEYASRPLARNRMSSFMEGINLENVFFVGLIENFEKDLFRLFQILNLKIDSVPVVNKNNSYPHYENISPDDLKMLEQLNAKDLKLYLQAVEINKKHLEL